jgi:hypothetical protein
VFEDLVEVEGGSKAIKRIHAIVKEIVAMAPKAAVLEGTKRVLQPDGFDALLPLLVDK